MLNDDAFAVVRAVSVIQREVSGVASKLKENPTQFVEGILDGSGIPIPDAFHVHTINEGDDLPEEDIQPEINRDAYLFRLSGEWEHTSDDKSKCKNCENCVVIEVNP